MTRNRALTSLLLLIVLVIAIARIGRTLLPAFKPVLFPSDTTRVTSTIPEGDFVPVNGTATFIESPDNLSVSIFAKDLESPRTLLFDSGGALLVGTNKGSSVIRLLDNNNDGTAESSEVLLSGLDRPHGLALDGSTLYVAEEEEIKAYPYSSANLLETTGVTVMQLPKGGRHFTRTLAIGKNDKMYISVGSSCDTCLERDNRYASILELDLSTKESRVFASGLRNAVYIKFRPSTGELFGTEMGRDHLGDALPPDEVNIIKEGRNYGWPFCYSKQIYDKVFGGVNNCQYSEPSLIDLPAHVSPLGFAFIPESWGTEYAGDLIVAFHGSWNSTIPVGYRVERFEKRSDGGFEEIGKPFLSGFLDENNIAIGRPVDLAFDSNGTLYMSDDKGGFIYAFRLKK